MPFFQFVYEGLPSDPLGFWQRLHPRPRYGFFLGSSVITMSAAGPSVVFTSSRSLFQAVRQSRAASAAPQFVGVFGFEAGRDFDRGIARLPRQTDPLKIPAVAFGDYPAVVQLDLNENCSTLNVRGTLAAAQRFRKKFEALFYKPSAYPSHQKVSRQGYRRGKFQTSSQERFSSMVRRAKQAIGRGDIYQANISVRFQRDFAGDAVKLYSRLTEKNPSPYRALFKQGNHWIVSCSPELLMRVEDGRVITRPIAGTRPRGKTSRLDRSKAGQMLLSPKERAEHIMLVDLERNDLGRVCRPGSVRVTERMAVERYSHVMHIVSQVEGRLSRGRNAVDALKSLFPGGTITGCPKIKSIQVIEGIEAESRSIFYGSAGTFSPNGNALFNILIRTALIKNSRLAIQAGAGIVADSEPKREYREVLAKAGALLQAVNEVA